MRFDASMNGQYALLHDQKVIEVYQTREDAFKTGLLLYKKIGTFSVQKIGESPAGLGFVGTCLV